MLKQIQVELYVCPSNKASDTKQVVFIVYIVYMIIRRAGAAL